MVIETTYGPAWIQEVQYANNGRLCLRLVSECGSPLTTLTVNLPDESLADGEFFVKDYSENEQIAADCLASGLFTDTGRRVPSGWVQIPVWKYHPQA